MYSRLYFQHVIFHATSKSRSHSKTVATLRRPGIAPYAADDLEGQTFHIPPLPPSYLMGCRIIDIKYSLKVPVELYNSL